MQKIPLRNSSASMLKWSKVTVPIYFKIHIFHVTNPVEVETRNAIPIVEERGPYTFVETREKKVVDISNDTEHVTYHDLKTFYFNRELSVGDLDDNVTVINVPLMVNA